MILLAPSSDPVERVRALDRGADDVIGRPFAYEELLARIRALLRRTHGALRGVIVAGELVVDRPTRRVHVRDTPVVALGEGVRARREARVAAVSRLHEGGAAARGLGVPSARPYRTLESHASRVRKKLCVGAG